MRDLHTLWYVVLRERNLLATQKEEARRMGIQNTSALAVPIKLAHVRAFPPSRRDARTDGPRSAGRRWRGSSTC
jgi:hypothetical protein